MARLVAAAWILLIVAGLAVGASGSARARGAMLNDSPGCIWKWTTGVDCPLCGMTHATVALGAGDLHAAHRAHPLAIVVILGVLALLGIVAAGRSDALLVRRRLIVIMGVIGAIWVLRLLL
jgi:hypothetical protein